MPYFTFEINIKIKHVDIHWNYLIFAIQYNGWETDYTNDFELNIMQQYLS